MAAATGTKERKKQGRKGGREGGKRRVRVRRGKEERKGGWEKRDGDDR